MAAGQPAPQHGYMKLYPFEPAETPNIGDGAGGLIQAVVEYYHQTQRTWDNLLLYLGKSTANRFFQLVPSWDSYKRNVTSKVLGHFRESFYEYPRPWFDSSPQCMYSSSPDELNFAIHVRLGDRKRLKNFSVIYFNFLEVFMDKVTTAITRRGLDSPTFHIFSETSMPCPSEEDGIFPEFQTWPVEQYQPLSDPSCVPIYVMLTMGTIHAE